MSYLTMMKMTSRPIYVKCDECDTPTLGWKAPDGRVLCPDCYFKIWGERPKG